VTRPWGDAIAVVAGLLSFLSPCVLPIVPPYLAFMGGVSVGEMEEGSAARRRVLLAAAFFVLGLSTVFILLGFAFSSMGRLFLQFQDWFVVIAGIVVMIFGAHFVGVFRIGFLDREARIEAGDRGVGAYPWYNPWPCCIRRRCRARHDTFGVLCDRIRHSISTCRGILPTTDEAAHDPDRAHIRSAFVDRWSDDVDRTIHCIQLVVA